MSGCSLFFIFFMFYQLQNVTKETAVSVELLGSLFGVMRVDVDGLSIMCVMMYKKLLTKQNQNGDLCSHG